MKKLIVALIVPLALAAPATACDEVVIQRALASNGGCIGALVVPQVRTEVRTVLVPVVEQVIVERQVIQPAVVQQSVFSSCCSGGSSFGSFGSQVQVFDSRSGFSSRGRSSFDLRLDVRSEGRSRGGLLSRDRGGRGGLLGGLLGGRGGGSRSDVKVRVRAR